MATVDTIQSSGMEIATNMADSMTGFLQKLADITSTGIDISGIHLDPIWVDPTSGASISAMASSPPASPAISLVNPVKPLEPALTPISLPILGDAPELLMVEPTINIPAAPDATLPGAPGAAPEFHSPTIPDSPTIRLPAVPVFTSITIDDVPTYDIPTYSSTMPVDDITTPSNAFSYVEPVYDMTMMDALKAKLMNDLLNGGYGIDDADEQRLWIRARERELANAELSIQDASRQVAARGFQVPPGVLNALVQTAQQTALDKNSSLSRDIMIKKAELYVQNRQFTIQEVRACEDLLQKFHGYMAERMLNAAKYTAEFAHQLFQAQVARYNARLEAIKVGAARYEIMLKAAIAHLEAYKLVVESKRVAVELQRVQAEVYRAQLEGVQAAVNVYRTQMEAAQIFASVEKLKLEAFKSAVDAYTAQVGAKSAEFGMFESRIKGETAKISAYQATVAAYAAKVGAYKAKADTSEISLRAQIAGNNFNLDKYKAQLMAYGEELKKTQLNMHTLLGLYEADLKRFSIRVDAEAKAVNAKIEANSANATTAAANAQVASHHILGQAQAYVAFANMTSGAAGTALQGLGTAASGAAQAASGLVAQVTSA